MKVAVSSTGKDLDSQIDPRFGRCSYFVIVDVDTMSYQVFDNENIALGGGAGIQSAQFVASKGAQAVITGNCGPNAVRTLSAAGVKVIVGQRGSVRRAVDDYRDGNLKSTSEPNVSDHYGMQNSATQGGGGVSDRIISMGMGRGSGMGRGMGRCGGKGRGMGRGVGMGASARPSSDQAESGPLSPQEALKSLKDQMDGLQMQIEAIRSRINSSDQK